MRTDAKSRVVIRVAWPLAMAFAGVMLWTIARGAADSAGASTPSLVVDYELTLDVPRGGQWHTVQMYFLLRPGDGDGERERQEARGWALSAIPGAVESQAVSLGSTYVTTGYWWPGRDVSWQYNGAGKPSGLSAELSVIQAAAGTWGAVGADVRFSYAGSTTAAPGACGGGSPDGLNTVGWGTQTGSVLAVTCVWYGSPSDPYQTASEFDLRIDPEWAWTTSASGPEVDLQSVVTHEFGHALGLGHSTSKSAVMYSTYVQGTLRRELQPDDIDGILAIYGPADGGVPPATATPEPPSLTPTSTAPLPGGTRPATKTATPPTPTPTPTAQSAGGTAAPVSPTVATHSPSPTPTRQPGTPTSSSTPTVDLPAPPSRLPLRPGANLLTWPVAATLPQALASDSPPLTGIYAWDGASRAWKRWARGLPQDSNTLTLLEPGHAYWFIASGDGVLRLESAAGLDPARSRLQ